MWQKRKREQFILQCKDSKPLSKPLEEIKISADTSATADEDADEAISDADDVSNPDEGECAVDAAEYIKTTAEVVTWLVPPPALPPERTSIRTAWIDAEVRGYTNGMREATEAVGTTREGGLYSAEVQPHKSNKECTATEGTPPIMAGGQDTGSDGHATTYSKVGSDERTTAGDDSRKLDIGGTTSDTEAAAGNESTVHSGTDESVPDYGATTGATGDERGVSSGDMFSTKADGQSTRSERCTAVCSSLSAMMRKRTAIDMKGTTVCSKGSYSYVVPVLGSTEITTGVTRREGTMRYRTPCIVNCNKRTPIGTGRSG